MNIPLTMKQFFERQAIVPFETMLAFFFIYAAIAAMINFGITVSPLVKVVGPKIGIVFYSIYLLAGLGMYFGVGLRRADVEGFGLILIATFLVVVTIANSWVFGVNPMVINSYVLNAAFVFSCVIRLRTILRGQRVLNRGAV
jgi:hypothetical protein